MAAKLTGHEKLRIKLRMFLELFTTDKNELILAPIKTSNWDQYLEEHEFWKMLGTEKPKRNYNTVRNLYLYMQKLLQETV